MIVFTRKIFILIWQTVNYNFYEILSKLRTKLYRPVARKSSMLFHYTEASSSQLEKLKEEARGTVHFACKHPEWRIFLRKDFYKKYGYSRDNEYGFGNAELAFLRWKIDRGVYNAIDDKKSSGSLWWRNVNEEYIYYAELSALLHESKFFSPNFYAPIRYWLAYFQNPSSQSWYRAHNCSIIHAYINNIYYAFKEDPTEQFFMNIVLNRVLFAQLMIERGGNFLGRLGYYLAHPSLPTVDILLQLQSFYPRQYPLKKESFDKLVEQEAKYAHLPHDYVLFSQEPSHPVEVSATNAYIHKISKGVSTITKLIQPQSFIYNTAGGIDHLYKYIADSLEIPQLTYFQKEGKSIYPNIGSKNFKNWNKGEFHQK